MVVKRDLGVHSGKLTGFRALEEGKFEASIRGSGTFVGKEIKEFGTMTMEVLENGATCMAGVGTLRLETQMPLSKRHRYAEGHK